MHCKQCGRVIDNDSRFCRHCGTAQDGPSSPLPGHDQIVVRPAPITPEETAPAKGSNGRLIGIGAAVIVALIAIGRCSGGEAPTNSIAAAAIDDRASDAATAPAVAPSATPSPVPANWSYSTDEDKLRGATTYFARTTSTNTIHQSPPYDGGITMTMTIRKHPRWGTDVMLSISEGQLMCPSYEGCSGMVRFDSGPARSVRFLGPEDNSSEMVFVSGSASFIAKLRKAKKVTIEKTIYQAGAPQFEFAVAGLRWTH